LANGQRNDLDSLMYTGRGIDLLLSARERSPLVSEKLSASPVWE